MRKQLHNFLFVLFPSLLSPQLQSQSYCDLQGRIPYANIQPGIIRFSLNKVTRTSFNVESLSGVVVNTGLTDSLQQLQTYTVTIRHTRDSINFPSGSNNIRVYIDYNQDWDFTDAGETVISKNYLAAGVFTGTFNIPASAATGITGMRVTAKMSQDVGHTAPTPCDIPADPLGYHGEMEDYWIHIAQAPDLLGTNKGTKKWEAVLYPNPVSQQLLLDNPDPNLDYQLELYDVNGRLLASENFVTSDSHKKPAIDISRFNEGVYFIKLKTNSDSVFLKIIIQH